MVTITVDMLTHYLQFSFSVMMTVLCSRAGAGALVLKHNCLAKLLTVASDADPNFWSVSDTLVHLVDGYYSVNLWAIIINVLSLSFTP